MSTPDFMPVAGIAEVFGASAPLRWEAPKSLRGQIVKVRRHGGRRQPIPKNILRERTPRPLLNHGNAKEPISGAPMLLKMFESCIIVLAAMWVG
jgi:hypothetical protein